MWLTFVRLSTKIGLFPFPLRFRGQRRDFGTGRWRRERSCSTPGPAHTERLADLLADVGSGGNLVNDAHLAAIAREQRAEIVGYDYDFALFAEVRWRRPDDL